MKRLLYLLPFLAINVFAAQRRIPCEGLSKEACSALNRNFEDIEGQLKNTVKKSNGDILMDADSTFDLGKPGGEVANIYVDTVTANHVFISSSIGSGTPAQDAVYADLMPRMMAIIANSGSPSLTYGVNVSSLTDVSTGITRITLKRAFATANYVCTGTTSSGAFVTLQSGNTTTNMSIRTMAHDGSVLDLDFVVVCFGDQ